MLNDNKHINYTADDIQRYLRGKMTPQEMHALEKAALDDEFLADAIEGFALVDDEHTNVLEGLKDSLAHKTSGKVVEMKKGEWKQWYRIAATLFILLGSAAIFYKYIFTDEQKQPQEVIAKQETKTNPEPATNQTAKPDTNDSIELIAANTKPITPETKKTETLTFKDSTVTISNADLSQADIAANSERKESLKADDAATTKAPAPNTIAAIIPKQIPATDNYKFTQSKKAKATDKDFEGNASGIVNANANAGYKLSTNANTQNFYSAQNIFKGRVINANNEPLPFAKVSIVNDSFKIGTYSDAKGYFNFIAADTLLKVEARSIGFNNQTSLLKSGVLYENKLVMQEESPGNADIVIKSNRIDRVKSLRDLLKDTSSLAVPEDGWGNYATYMANNLELPGHIKSTAQHGMVELSFTVDRNGNPQNISIDKSFDKQTDAEAVRLIKEGPKWKAKNRKNKGKVVVVF